MFDFEKLEVYTHVRRLVSKVLAYLYTEKNMDAELKEALKSSVLKVMFTLAEGTGQMTTPAKLNYYTKARTASFESVAILQVLMDSNQVDYLRYEEFYKDLETTSKMLLGMIRSFKKD